MTKEVYSVFIFISYLIMVVVVVVVVVVDVSRIESFGHIRRAQLIKSILETTREE